MQNGAGLSWNIEIPAQSRCLFPPESSWMELFFFRAAGDDRDACIPNSSPVKHQPRFPAEQHREEIPEMMINRIERLLKLLSRLTIDPSNGIFQGSMAPADPGYWRSDSFAGTSAPFLSSTSAARSRDARRAISAAQTV